LAADSRSSAAMASDSTWKQHTSGKRALVESTEC
jgi:hypothetical protein